jgi:hypothetical protein
MMPVHRLVIVSCILALVMTACSITVDLGTAPSPTATQSSSSQEQVSTMVAQTLQAFTQAALSATPANTATPTNTPVPPTLSVSVATNCYAGPRSNYGFVITVYPGTTVAVVGKDPADNYWIIVVPNYPGTVCWLAGQYASLSGDTGNLPAPATPAISTYTLSEPRGLRISCTSQLLSGTPGPGSSEWTVVFRWSNTDPDQTGVRVYRNGRRIASLGGHATSYTDSLLFHHRHHDVTYGVQAVNSGAVSSIVTIELDHCR